MKRVFSVVLAVVLLLGMTACGGKNIEKFCDNTTLVWDGYEGQNNDEIRYTAEFTDGVLTITKEEAEKFSVSPTGMRWTEVETNTYNYKLEGNDTVIVDGEKYTYKINDNRVEFNIDLMGIESWWKK